jgi:hypothetical protein
MTPFYCPIGHAAGTLSNRMKHRGRPGPRSSGSGGGSPWGRGAFELHPTRFPSLWACVRGRSARSVTWSCGPVRFSADALEPRRMRPELRPARSWSLKVLKRVRGSPPAAATCLSVLGAGSPSMIIPRISRAQSGRTRPGTPASPGAPGVADGPRCRRDWAAARTFTVISGG